MLSQRSPSARRNAEAFLERTAEIASIQKPAGCRNLVNAQRGFAKQRTGLPEPAALNILFGRDSIGGTKVAKECRAIHIELRSQHIHGWNIGRAAVDQKLAG